MNITVNAEIMNMSDRDYSNYRYLVARQDVSTGKPQLWYYGLYEDKASAEEAAVECRNGLVLEIAR